jgi:hypothetical protein
MIQYILGYGCFLLGAVLYILGKIQEYQQMADANPNPRVIFSTKDMFRKEIINLLRLLIGGIALVIFMPKLAGGTTVDFKNVSGQVVTTVAFQTLLLPFYFIVGYSGNSALFTLFGKYKKTLFNQVGVDS